MEQLREGLIRLGLEESYRRGDIFYADLGKKEGSEQAGLRPVIIIQNDIGNKYSPTVIVASITSRNKKSELPVHVSVNSENLEKDSTILLEQIRTLDKRKLRGKIGRIDFNTTKELNFALGRSLGLI
ncbi:type II toxin-antitoxin system PemK/MazF family toxin [Clostridium baratii]|uniref:type II toxin-antitoxin system PemK/MazF family toxin n=1 Tax=Clostridium baratii TaxID=1561 RepID=UPI0030CDC9F5